MRQEFRRRFRERALALISRRYLLVVRMNDPLLPRMLFGVLNILLFYPSGALYPTNSFPPWMQVITVLNPFTYAVDGFKSLLLKDTGFAGIAMAAATKLFRRTL